MTVLEPQWFLREFFFSRNDKSACITAMCRGKCFPIQVLPHNLRYSPSALDKYMRLICHIINDEDQDAEDAEYGLLDWIFDIFSSIFANLELTYINSRRYTLEQCLHPETYRYCICSVDKTLQPLLHYDVPMEPLPLGVTWDSPSSTWQTFQPVEIEVADSGSDELLSQSPKQVFAGGFLCFLKLYDRDDKRAAEREMAVYKQIEDLNLGKQLNVPHVHGVVREGVKRNILGLLLSWINCQNRMLECAVVPGTPLDLQMKWESQVTKTVNQPYSAGIVWGDAKAANVLIDEYGDAWIIDFECGYTHCWVEKDEMETEEGDHSGLSKIKDMLYCSTKWP